MNNANTHRLFEFGKPESHDASTWPNYLDNGFGREDIPSLTQIIQDELPQRQLTTPKTEMWASLYACRILSQLTSDPKADLEEALSAIIGQIEGWSDDPWAQLELPYVLSAFDEAAIEPLSFIMNDNDANEYSRVLAIVSLTEIAKKKKTKSTDIADELYDYLRNPDWDAKILNGFVIDTFIQLEGEDLSESIEEIREFFRKKAVEITICGDQEEIEILAGLRSERVTPKPDFSIYPKMHPEWLLDIENVDTIRATQPNLHSEETEGSEKGQEMVLESLAPVENETEVDDLTSSIEENTSSNTGKTHQFDDSLLSEDLHFSSEASLDSSTEEPFIISSSGDRETQLSLIDEKFENHADHKSTAFAAFQHSKIMVTSSKDDRSQDFLSMDMPVNETIAELSQQQENTTEVTIDPSNYDKFLSSQEDSAGNATSVEPEDPPIVEVEKINADSVVESNNLLTEEEQSFKEDDLAQLAELLDLASLEKPDEDDGFGFLDYWLMKFNDQEGLRNISELDGYFTSISCAPNSISPKQWLGHVWGPETEEPQWDSEEDQEKFYHWMFSHYNQVVENQSLKTFEPLFLESENNGQSVTDVASWCEGFLQGLSLWKILHGEKLLQLEDIISPIKKLLSEDGTPQRLYNESEMEAIQSEIEVSVHKLYDTFRFYDEPKVDKETKKAIFSAWSKPSKKAPEESKETTEETKEASAEPQQPIRLVTPKVGRNDPCPCGSGKKYKKCCLLN